MKEKLSQEAENDLDNILSMLDDKLGDPILPRPDGFGITVREYGQKKQCSETIARKMLEKAVEAGLLVKRQMVDGKGSSPFVYYKE